MNSNMRSISDLHKMQAVPLEVKIKMTERRITEWVDRFGLDGVYISFSGGKDSTVLLDIARKLYPNIKAAFVDTGLEYPEIRQFVKTYENVDWLKPKMNFRQVIEKYGYPFISKEVSECAYYAKKYLTSILEQENLLDRQTDRQTDKKIPYSYMFRKLCGIGEYQKHRKNDNGGGDAKYRKLAGIGEYSKRQNGKQERRSESKACDNVRLVYERQESSDKDGYP